MITNLPPNWEIVQMPGMPNGRFFYRERTNPPRSQWLRPTPPPGCDIEWPQLLHCAHILVKHSESRNPRSHNQKKGKMYVTISKEQALVIIKKHRTTILNLKKSFEEIAHMCSDCSSCQQGGDLRWTQRHKLDPDFEQCALNLPYGQNAISDPVLSPSGYHIIKRLDGSLDNIPPLPPPPPELELQISNRTPTSDIINLYQLIYLTEKEPTNPANWQNLINNHLKITQKINDVTIRFIRGYLHFLPSDETAFKHCFKILESQNKKELYEEILQEVQAYTWNPYFWNTWAQTEDRKEKIRRHHLMLNNVGHTVDAARLWEQYVKLLKEDGAPTEQLISVLETALSIGLSNSGLLIEQLKEYSPDLAQLYAKKIEEMTEIIKQREKRLYDARRPSSNLTEEQYNKWRKFLNVELTNPLQTNEEVFVDGMDYFYRQSLSNLWWYPNIWMEYWSFLVQKGRTEKADTILRLGRKAVGDTPIFELRRAQHLVKYGKYNEAKTILENLLKYDEPLLTSALTMLFKVTADVKSEEEALKIVTQHFKIAKPKFFVNAAKLCTDDAIAWNIFQMGVDRYPHDNAVVLAAAEFLDQHRDVRNARLLFQQSLDSNARFDIMKAMFNFELSHIAPLDHLNETQKAFRNTTVDSFILYMQRFRFMDLYPLDHEELNVLGHLSRNRSIDLMNELNETGYLTSTIPYGSSLDSLKIEESWIEKVAQNQRKATTIETPAQNPNQPKQNRIPRDIHHLYREISEKKLHFAPPDPDSVMNRINGFTVRDYRQFTQH